MKSSYIKYVIVVGVFFALLWNTVADPDKLWTHGLGIALCGLLMAWVAWVWYRECARNTDAVKLESYAEQIYMLGYLLTLSAIGGTLLRLFFPGMSGATLDKAIDSATIFSIGGVKLVTTIFGLVVMFFFKEEAAQWSGYDDTVERYLERIRLATEKMVTHAETISDRVENMAAAFSQTVVQDLGRNMTLFSNSVAAGHRAADDFVKKTDACSTSQGTLKVELDKVKTTASELDVGLKNLETASTALKTGLDGLTPRLQELANLFTPVWFADVKKQFGQLVDACTQSVSIWRAFEQQTSAIATKSLVDLKNRIDGAAESTGKLGSDMDKLSAHHFPVFTKEFQQIAEGATNTRKHVLESVAAINKAAETLQTLNGILEKLTRQSADVSQIGTELQKVKEGTNQLRTSVQEGLESINGVTTSLQALNGQLARLQEHCPDFPATMANLRQTVGHADAAFGGVNGKLRSFAEGLDSIIARSERPRHMPSALRQPEEPQVPKASRAQPPPVRVRLPDAEPQLPKAVDTAGQPGPAHPPPIESPQPAAPALSSDPPQSEDTSTTVTPQKRGFFRRLTGWGKR